MPHGMIDKKCNETVSVGSSEDICETLLPCNEPNAEEVPRVEENPTDRHWSNFKENAPKDSPCQDSPVETCIPKAFDNEFGSVLYSSCKNYHEWIAEAVEIMQNAEQLNRKVC